MRFSQTCLLAIVCAASILVACRSTSNTKAPADAAVGGSAEGGSASGGTTVAATGGTAGSNGSTRGGGGTLAGGFSGSGGFATGGAAAGDGAIALNATEVCRAAVRVQCERTYYCLGNSTGDKETLLHDCLTRVDLCPDYEFSADSNRNVTDVAACIDQLAARPCTDILLYTYPPCLVNGTRPGGAACAFNSQCQSGECFSTDSGCSTCNDVIVAGRQCPNLGLCQTGTFCHPKTNLCTDASTIVHAAAGQPCDLYASPRVSCVDDLSCVSPSSGTGASICTPRPVAGQACTGPCGGGTDCADSTLTCELPGTCGAGVRCDAASYCRTGDGGLTCAPRATTGQSCSTSNSDGLPPCLAPAVCPYAMGKCVAPRASGESCDANNPCAKPLSCASGTCQKLTALSCPA
jgi:hypothetical protein